MPNKSPFMQKFFLALLLTLTVGAAHATLKIEHWTLANGARVYFVESHAIPVVDMSVEFDAGSRRDPQGKTGVSGLANAMLARGLRCGSFRAVVLGNSFHMITIDNDRQEVVRETTEFAAALAHDTA